jgi:hypothetical protein
MCASAVEPRRIRGGAFSRRHRPFAGLRAMSPYWTAYSTSEQRRVRRAATGRVGRPPDALELELDACARPTLGFVPERHLVRCDCARGLKPPSPCPMAVSVMRSRATTTPRGRGRAPLPVLAALVVLVAAGPIGLALSRDEPRRKAAATSALSDIVRDAGCELTEFDADPRSNPPVSGHVDERVWADDGSYVGRRPPSELAAVHALLHGRVLMQYQPRLAAGQIRALSRLVREDSNRVLLFANQTGMRQPIAATAYLTLMTCPRVDVTTLNALRAFRDRRRAFGQRF